MSKENEIIYVTRPALPDLSEFIPYLEKIWESRWLTNNGPFHQEFEKALAEYLGVKHVSLFSNGTLALVTALQAMRINGEVITTPYSFVASTHSLWWNGIKPVFVDIEPEFMNINPDRIEVAITTQTTAIMPVHIYGNPCNVEKIQHIADTYGLKVIYDACHAFGVTINGTSVLNYGDLSVLSFHATKVFTTFEGGAIISHDEKMKKRIDFLKNFGFADEVTVVAPGINAKMNEIQSAFGILQLKHFDAYAKRRTEIAQEYRKHLSGVQGIRILSDIEGVRHTYPYYPILIDENKYGRKRNELYELLKMNNFHGRRYFYPLISQFPTYRGLPSAAANNLPVAEKITQEILCLPIYPDLELESVRRICKLINRQAGPR
jgi:dTDP-4-amino-4,6-dideoxygalactose transaminase